MKKWYEHKFKLPILRIRVFCHRYELRPDFVKRFQVKKINHVYFPDKAMSSGFYVCVHIFSRDIGVRVYSPRYQEWLLHVACVSHKKYRNRVVRWAE